MAVNTSELAALQQYAVEERDKKKPWYEIAKALLNRNGMSPADAAEVILPLVDDQGSASSVLWALVLLPGPSTDFVAVRRTFEAHGVDLRDAIKHMMDPSSNDWANMREAARRLGLKLD
jgi:hypothetical protein